MVKVATSERPRAFTATIRLPSWAWLIWTIVAGFAAPALAIDQQVGQRFEIRAEDMPAPFHSESATNPPRRIDRPDGALPAVPAGFAVNVFAEGLDHARWLAVAPNGDVLVAEPRPGKVTLLRDADGDGAAEFRSTFLSGLDRPHGLAFREGALYVADVRAVWRYAYAPGQTRAEGAARPITPPGALGDSAGHWTRNIAFSEDGSAFYVAVGSRSNRGVEPAPRATVQRFDADGGNQDTFAAGLRNPVGIARYPGTEDIYVVVNERDGFGDDLVPDYLTRIRTGEFYGWPYAYIGGVPDPDYAEARPDLVEKTKMPDLLFEAHAAALGLAFYEGDAFPERYRGDAFVALHGSWNAARPRGYMVVHVPFEEARPEGHYLSFMTGFWSAGEGRARVWGRPVGLAVARDGSLLVADDVGQRVWRISYEGEGAGSE